MSEEYRQTAIAVVQSALGAVQHVAHDHMVANVEGRQLDVRLLNAQISRGRSYVSAPYRVLALQMPLAVGALRFTVNRRDNYVHVGDVPIVSTGEPFFDSTFAVAAVPAEVVTPALDEPTRGWMLGCGPDVQVGADDDGILGFAHAVTLPNQQTNFPLTPEKVHAAAHALRHLAEALERTYHARRAEIVATQGEAGALSWEEQNRKLIAARPTRPLLYLAVGCIGVGLLAILLATVLFTRAIMDFTGS